MPRTAPTFLALLVTAIPVFAQAQSLAVKWEELTAGDFVKALQKSSGVCVLPFGIIEKHGPHLPLGTDLINIRYLVQHAAEKEYAVVFPEYYFGQILKHVMNPVPSPTALIFNLNCFRKLPTRWVETDAPKF